VIGAPSRSAGDLAELNEKIDTTQAFTCCPTGWARTCRSIRWMLRCLRCRDRASQEPRGAPAGDGAARKAEPARALPSGGGGARPSAADRQSAADRRTTGKLFRSGAADGFNVMPPFFPGQFDDFVEGWCRSCRSAACSRDYEGSTLRETSASSVRPDGSRGIVTTNSVPGWRAWISSVPSNCETNAVMIRMPSPFGLVRSKPGGKPAPSSRTEIESLSPMRATVTQIVPPGLSGRHTLRR